jgi:hypothetical protein
MSKRGNDRNNRLQHTADVHVPCLHSQQQKATNASQTRVGGPGFQEELGPAFGADSSYTLVMHVSVRIHQLGFHLASSHTALLMAHGAGLSTNKNKSMLVVFNNNSYTF